MNTREPRQKATWSKLWALGYGRSRVAGDRDSALLTKSIPKRGSEFQADVSAGGCRHSLTRIMPLMMLIIQVIGA